MNEESLSRDCFLYLLKFLDIRELINVSRVSRWCYHHALSLIQSVTSDWKENIRVVVQIDNRNIFSYKPTIEKSGNLVMIQRDFSGSYFEQGVFDMYTPISELYCYACFPVIESVIQGYTGSIIAFGQSGTGKRSTIFGEMGKVGERDGIAKYAFHHLFQRIDSMNQDVKVRLSFFEIIQEQLLDLLEDNVQESKKILETNVGNIVEKAVFITVDNAFQLEQCINHALDKRMDKSLRGSHLVCQLLIETPRIGSSEIYLGKLNFVTWSGAETPERACVQDGQYYLSTSVLNNMVTYLTEKKIPKVPKPKSATQSKATHLLNASFGGNCKTVLLGCVSPHPNQLTETLGLLRFFRRCTRIVNCPTQTIFTENWKEFLQNNFIEKKMSLKTQEDHDMDMKVLDLKPMVSNMYWRKEDNGYKKWRILEVHNGLHSACHD